MLRRPFHAAAAVTAVACGACQAASAPMVGPADPSPPPPFDMGIDGVYLTQSAQDDAGTVPLVRGRAGLLRIFLRAAPDGIAAPSVRASLVDTASGGVLRSYVASSWPMDATYAHAHIGVFGWDPSSGAMKDPVATGDHMSYGGEASTTWKGGYGYRAAMDFLAGAPLPAGLQPAANPRPVWWGP